MDPEAASLGLALGEEERHRSPLASDVAVGVVREGPALAVGREVAALAEAQARLGAQDQVHPAREGLVGAPVPDRAAGHVERHEGRRAGRVHGRARSAEVEEERDPIGDNAPRRAGVAGRPDLDVLGLDRPVVVAAGADEHARAAPGQLLEGDPGVLDRLVARLEDQALLGVHPERFFGSDPEEPSVKSGHFAEEPAAGRLEVSALAEVGVVEPLGVPAIFRDGHDPRAPLAEERLEVCERGYLAWEAAADADDR